MSEWQKHKLGELCTRITVGHVGSMASRYTENGIPFLRSLNVKRGRIDLSAVKYINKGFHGQLAKSQLRPGDLVIVRTGDPGVTALIPDGLGPLNCSDVVIATPRSDVDARFLCYAINETAQEFVKAHTVGAVQQHFNVKSAKELTLHVPELAHQQAVSGLLGALDDKIAVNERIAATADELMRALYQEACANAAESITIGELGRLIRDGVSASSLNGGEHYIGLEHMPRRNVWLSAWEESAELASGKSAFRSNDVLFGKLRPYFHKVGLALTSGVCSTDILVVRPAEPDRLGWLLLALSSDEVVAHASAVGDGTRMPRAKWRDLEPLVVPWPGNEEAARLDQVVRSMAARVQASVTESRTLATLRDTLLPQLMSGRLRVKDAEKIVEDHA
ncbi:restriction endonuclease subunit S [Streptomyces sp. NPDC005393]|uniref:restriction endonuclease subunit S n=1 Tax=Streptomyces sp. NPDC005393 TaxID=3157041 RepID=UPI0033B2E825